MSTCVYCGITCPEEGFPKEHVVPRGLGEFRLDGKELVITNRVCGGCNNALGKCDGELCYGGPEAMLRRRIGIKGRIKSKKIKKESPFHPNGRSREPIRMRGKRPGRDHEDYWEIDEKGELRERLSFQFIHPEAQKVISVSINPEMTSESFREAIKAAGYPGGEYPGEFFCDDEDRQWIDRLLCEDVTKMKWEDRRQLTDKETIEVEAEMTITPQHNRAIAKIAFNHMMYFQPMDLKGLEPEFENLRRFILHGIGHPQDFVRYVKGDVLSDLSYGRALADYGHLVTCEVGPRLVTAKVQLCTGRTLGYGYYDVTLGKYPFAIYRGLGRIGHYFRITSAPTDKRDKGEVMKLFSPTRVKPVQLHVTPKHLLIPKR